MATYFVGSFLDSIQPVTTGISEDANGINVNGTGGGNHAQFWLTNPTNGVRAGFTKVWTHMNVTWSHADSNQVGLLILNSSGTQVFRMVGDGGGMKPQYWNGTTWVAFGTGSTNFKSGVLDILIEIAVAGKIHVYWNQQLVVDSGTIDTTGMVNVASCQLRPGANFNANNLFHGIICADYSTIGHTVRRRNPSGVGAHTAWTGDHTSVNTHNDTTHVASSAVGQKETFTANTLTATSTGNVIKAVAVASRIRNDGSGTAPQKARHIVRIGTTDYAGPDLTIGTGYEPRVTVFEQDPSVAANWSSITNVNTEFGLESRT